MADKKVAYILHGLFSNSTLINISSMKLILNVKGYKVKVPEYIGHGRRKGDPLLLHDTMKEINEMIGREDDGVVIIGHSIGGAMALCIGMINPNVKKVYAISAPNGRHTATKEQMKNLADTIGLDLSKIDGCQFRQIIRVMPVFYGDCSLRDKKDFYLLHCKNDAVVPVQEFHENAEMLCVNDENTLLIDKITGDGIADHAMMIIDYRVLKFVNETLL